MRLSLNWLQSYFEVAPNWETIWDKLTNAGIEIEGIEPFANNGLTDSVVEFKITPNRGDCLSVTGLLREIAALTEYKIKPLEIKPIVPTVNTQINIIMDAPLHCPNYMAICIKEINNKVKLPDEIYTRLSCTNIRSISPIVDITNYVMLLLGQPLHAFDANHVGAALHVRLANNGEELQLLDDSDVKLIPDTLLICDSKNNPAAIAGVMGGLHSGVIDDTTDIILESAFFTPEIIAGRAKQYGVNSDSAYRYERGVDVNLQQQALALATDLIIKYCGGSVGQITHIDNLDTKLPISITYERINRLIGTDISSDIIDAILNKLGFSISSDGISLTLVAPSYRFDINIAEDIVEEVARVYGYDNIVPIMPTASYSLSVGLPRPEGLTMTLKNRLVTLGYNEIVAYSFIEEKYENLLGRNDIDAIRLKNPLAGLNVMHTSLIADLIKALLSNLNRGQQNIRLFELARVFHGEDELSQPLKIAGLIYGDAISSSWAASPRAADFYDLKHVVEILLSSHKQLRFVANSDSHVFHSGRCAKIYVSEQEIGVIGQLHPKIGQELGLTLLPYLFELDVALVENNLEHMELKKLSKFQKVERDLAFLFPEAVAVGSVLDAINSSNIEYLQGLNVFDVYQGTNVTQGFKSVAINFIFQADKNLTDEEIDANINNIINLVNNNFQAQLR
jgi:phenylalanyl-tRNA synthetase beta chain